MITKRRAVEALEFTPPSTLLEVLLREGRLSHGFNSLQTTVSFISNPRVAYETKSIALLFCLVSSSREKLVDRFLSDCDVPVVLFNQAKALLALDKAAIAKAKQIHQGSATPIDDHREYIHQFLIFFDASMCSNEVCKQVLVNLTVMEAPWAVSALFASNLDWKLKLGSDFCIQVLILNNLQTHLGGLVGDDQGELSEREINWLASEISKGGFQATTAFVNSCLQKAKGRAEWTNETRSEKEREVLELLRQERLDQALELLNQNGIDTKEFTPSTRFLIKLAQENKWDWRHRENKPGSHMNLSGAGEWQGVTLGRQDH
jgi:hypothetical protein